MRGKLYKVLNIVCGAIGRFGEKIKFWAEFKEWEYWNNDQCKVFDLPKDLKVFLWYNRKGDYLKVNVEHCPLVSGRYGKFTTLSRIELKEQDVLQILKMNKEKDIVNNLGEQL